MTQNTNTTKHAGGMRTLTAGLFLAMIFTAGALRAAAPAFAPIFNRGAVLQCEMPVKVWGTAGAGAAVSILLDGNPVAETKAQPDGRWTLEIPAQKPGGPHTLEAKGADASTQIEDVWFGEVWIASGQSNMVQPLANAEGGTEALARTVPDIRFVVVPKTTGLPAEAKLTAQDLAWKEFAPPANARIASAAFFFADRLHEETGRRVGIVQTSVGGVFVTAWMPLSALLENPAFAWHAETRRKAEARPPAEAKAEWENFEKASQALAKWKKNPQGEKPAAVPDPGLENSFNPKSPTVLWENMAAPLVPYTARGIIWYQGEANARGPEEYRLLFPALIGAWREAWKRPDWPFLFVQLASLQEVNGKPPAGDWPGLRAAQAFTRDTVPHTGMALAIDSGEREDIHPKYKKPVGERLARLALAQVYARDIVARGPLLTKAETREGRVQLTFEHAGTGLKTSDGKAEVPGFELAGVDKKFHPATAKISGKDTVELLCPEVTAPTSVRYAWAAWVEPPVTLQNSAGLPAEPSERKLP
jgi:sialate O-acetylesterase